MRDAPPSWRPVGGRALLPVQPPLVHQPAAVRDDLGLPTGRPTPAESAALSDPLEMGIPCVQMPPVPKCYWPDCSCDLATIAAGCGTRHVAKVSVPPADINAEYPTSGSAPPDAPVLAVARNRPLPKLPRTMMRSWVARHLKTKQGGLCPLCRKTIDLTIKGEGVIDHDHDTGEIRGVLHRSCNAAEGKISNAAARWGAKDSSYAAVVAYLRSIVDYLSQPGAGIIYPMHKTPDEKKDAKNAKAKLARAAAKAKLALRGRKTE